jgi:3-carboxy-cis,cis-muconate cycloisomerase
VGEANAGFVHWGTTSQDLIDTALVLLLARGKNLLARDHQRLKEWLGALSERHAGTIMLSRTLLQPALPITFGYKVAGWYASVSRNWRRLSQSFDEALILEFGGAAGTLAAYGDRGPALAAELAAELQVNVPIAPWHTYRDRLAALVANLGIYTGSLGKIARDVTLLMQHEVGEVFERGGGSSAMPHKRNPAGSVLALAAAARVPGLVGTYLSLMVQEQERAAGAWQAEWQTIADVVCATGSAVAAVADVIEGLQVNADRMRANLGATHGAVLSEKAVMLGANLAAVEDAVQQVRDSGRSLADILGIELGSPEDYLGAAEHFRRELLKESE